MSCKCHCYTDIDNYEEYVFEIKDFLTNEECDGILEYLKTKENEYFASKIWRNGRDELDLDGRICSQRWCDVDEFVLFRKYTTKLNYIFGDLPKEQLLSLKYNPGGFFKSHYDSGEGQCDKSGTKIGFRKWTCILYLNDDFEGGGTHFPRINKKIIPEKGKVLCFLNTDDNLKVIKQSLHRGEPVLNGKKYILNCWLYQPDFEFD